MAGLAPLPKEADPFVMAKALVENKIVVTTEKFKPNAPKIPSVCAYFDVKHFGLFDFFRNGKWQF